MKTMKKFLAAAMAVTSIMAFAPMSAFAANETDGSTSVTFDAPHVSPEFIITIPQSVALSSSSSTATITATDVYLDTEKHTKINVTLDEASNTASGSTFHAKEATSGSEATYTINNGGEDNIAVGGIVAEFTTDGSKTLTFSAPEGATYAGTHTETLTFGISVENVPNPYLDAAVGNTVTFGNYDWYVIKKENDKVTLLMKTPYKIMKYHETREDVTWETCTVRTHLNDTFYNSFTDKEKEMIAKTTIHTEDNGVGIGGNDTEDYIYLLSIEEAEKLDRSILKYSNYSGYGLVWFLRSPSSVSQLGVATVDTIGLIDKDCNASAQEGNRYARPALTLDFN